MSGRYPESTPNVFWFPVGGPEGVVVVTSRSSNGPNGGDDAGNTVFWNNHLGVGPWWESPTPVRKIGNSRAGWTQALILRPDGKFLHVTSSGSPAAADGSRGGGNQMLSNVASISFNRYEAEDAAQRGAAVMRDASMSLNGKSRLGAKDVGTLTFNVHVPAAGSYNLVVDYAGIGFDATPRMAVNGALVGGSVSALPVDPERAARRANDLGTRGTGEHKLLTVTANLLVGDNIIEVLGGDYALDIDYLEVTPAGN